MAFRLTVREQQDNWLILPEGDLDIYVTPDFEKEVYDHLNKERKNIVMDFTKLEYMDSTGLGVLISLYKKVQESEHGITITNMKPSIRKLFTITELDRVFTIKEQA